MASLSSIGSMISRARVRLRVSGLLLGCLFVLLSVSAATAAPTSHLTTATASGAKISAHLTKTSFEPAQAGSVKLIYSFSAPSRSFSYLLKLKKGKKWQTVKSVKKTGSFKGSHTMTVKKVFAGKPVKVGSYRLKLSADGGSKLLSFVVKGSKPANTALPAISGTTTQGQTLTARKGSWSNSPTSYAYHWRRCNSSGASCGDISGATSGSYALALADVGATIRIAVTASNGYGSASATSNQTAAVAVLPPGAFNKTSPANGATEQLTSATLSWGSSSNAASYEYCVDTSNDNACAGAWVSVGASSSASPSGLTPSTTYYWQVRATNASGQTYSDGGAWWSFTTWKPTAGSWTTSSGVSFSVSSDQTTIESFSAAFSTGYGYIVVFSYNTPIVAGQFSKTGTYYYSGTFDSPTTAHGTVGLNNYCTGYPSSCYTGGPYTWAATWSSP